MNKVLFSIDWANSNLAAYVGSADRSFEKNFDWNSCYPLYRDSKFVGVLCAENGSHENCLVFDALTARIKTLNAEIKNDVAVVA